ncbi:agamous-like MADS-box protein AGL62 [Beta vulgaris subsp. vulgaris]|uniref:agamous-like MADS-box protein AGL62 n=1 Tax=Beta vulgaris subsp. vulgaris TaxID=3555 RepID=UPI00053F97AC|nr:agamous-like MADS-box protein AGL62 [Beta vulgaris subsp. vulgaris]
MAKKESRGRQKIKMARIKNPSHRQVTFSKRRLGLFKKASEICTLCGVEAIIIVFSPGQKIFSFGHPNVESIVSRYINRNTLTKMEAVQQNSTMSELNSQLTKILDLLEAEKSRGDVFNNLRRKSTQCWWETPINKLGLHELRALSASMQDLKNNLANQAMFLEKNTPSSSSMLCMDNNGISSNSGCGVGVCDQHFDLKSIEAKIQGFAHPDQLANFQAQKLF